MISLNAIHPCDSFFFVSAHAIGKSFLFTASMSCQKMLARSQRIRTYVEVCDVELLHLLPCGSAVDDILEVVRGIAARGGDEDLRPARVVL